MSEWLNKPVVVQTWVLGVLAFGTLNTMMIGLVTFIGWFV